MYRLKNFNNSWIFDMDYPISEHKFIINKGYLCYYEDFRYFKNTKIRMQRDIREYTAAMGIVGSEVTNITNYLDGLFMLIDTSEKARPVLSKVFFYNQENFLKFLNSFKLPGLIEMSDGLVYKAFLDDLLRVRLEVV